jgi:hypothetical protein
MHATPKSYIPMIGTLFLFILAANWSSLIPGIDPPTAHLETDAALGLIVFFAIVYFGICARRVAGYLRTFAEPIEFVFRRPRPMLGVDWQVALRSWMATQYPSPVAIAKADAATAKRLLIAIVELILDAAMVGAIWAAAEPIDCAMIAKPRRQCQRTLPICVDDR